MQRSTEILDKKLYTHYKYNGRMKEFCGKDSKEVGIHP